MSALPARLVPYTQVLLLVHLSEKPLQLRTTLEPNLEICLRVLRDTNRKGNGLIIFQEYWNFFLCAGKMNRDKNFKARKQCFILVFNNNVASITNTHLVHRQLNSFWLAL